MRNTFAPNNIEQDSCATAGLIIVVAIGVIAIDFDADDWNWNAVAADIRLLKEAKEVVVAAAMAVVVTTNKGVFDLILYKWIIDKY